MQFDVIEAKRQVQCKKMIKAEIKGHGVIFIGKFKVKLKGQAKRVFSGVQKWGCSPGV